MLLSIVSLTLIAYGGLRQKVSPALGKWALFSLCPMIAGAVGTAVPPHAYFGIAGRFGVFACSGFTGVLGVFQSRGWERQEVL